MMMMMMMMNHFKYCRRKVRIFDAALYSRKRTAWNENLTGLGFHVNRYIFAKIYRPYAKTIFEFPPPLTLTFDLLT